MGKADDLSCSPCGNRITGKELGARRGRSDGDEDGGEVVDVEGQVVEATVSSGSSSSRGKGGKGEKFRALKAREAASKAASAE